MPRSIATCPRSPDRSACRGAGPYRPARRRLAPDLPRRRAGGAYPEGQMAVPHPYSVSTFALLDGGVMTDVATALSGPWTPAREADVVRRARLVDAARLRLYGELDRSGWYLCTTQRVRDALPTDIHDWVAGLIPAVDGFEDAPAGDDLAALRREFMEQQGLTETAADALAHAVLFEPIRLLISNDPRAYKHARENDLPARLEIIDPSEAVTRLAIIAGEEPLTPPPEGVLPPGEPWWIG